MPPASTRTRTPSNTPGTWTSLRLPGTTRPRFAPRSAGASSPRGTIIRPPAWRLAAPAVAACLLIGALAQPAGPAPAPAAPSSRDTVGIAGSDSVGLASGSAVPDSAGAARDRLVAVETLVLRGTARGQALEPSAVAVDAFSHLLVADAGLHRVQWLDAHGRWLSEAGALGSGPGELRAAVGLAPLGSAGWALLDRETHRITAYDLFGRLTGVLVDFDADALTERLGRVDPVALATDRGGALYVADADRDRLLVFDFSGAFVRVLGGFGNRPGSFRRPARGGGTPPGEVGPAEPAAGRVPRPGPGGRAA